MKQVFSFENSKGITWYLHSKMVTLKNGKEMRIYYFMREVKENSMSELPAGYKVKETSRTAMPVLMKDRSN